MSEILIALQNSLQNYVTVQNIMSSDIVLVQL